MATTNTVALACNGKVKHTSFSEARQSLAHQRNLSGSRQKAMKVTPYKCGYCNTWHVGHNKRTAKPKHDTLTVLNGER